MAEHVFKLELKESVARKLDKKGHKAAMRWLRTCRREVEEAFHYDFFASKENKWLK